MHTILSFSCSVLRLFCCATHYPTPESVSKRNSLQKLYNSANRQPFEMTLANSRRISNCDQKPMAHFASPLAFACQRRSGAHASHRPMSVLPPASASASAFVLLLFALLQVSDFACRERLLPLFSSPLHFVSPSPRPSSIVSPILSPVLVSGQSDSFGYSCGAVMRGYQGSVDPMSAGDFSKAILYATLSQPGGQVTRTYTTKVAFRASHSCALNAMQLQKEEISAQDKEESQRRFSFRNSVSPGIDASKSSQWIVGPQRLLLSRLTFFFFVFFFAPT